MRQGSSLNNSRAQLHPRIRSFAGPMIVLSLSSSFVAVNIIHDQSVSNSLVVLNLRFGRESFRRQLFSESPPSVILKQELDNPYTAFLHWLTGQTLVRKLPDLSLQPCYKMFYSCGFHAFISHLQKHYSQNPTHENLGFTEVVSTMKRIHKH